MMIPTQIIRIVFGTIGTFAFSVTFNIRNKRLLVSSLGGFLCCFVFELSCFLLDNEVFSYFISAIIITLFSEIFARVLKTPTTTFVIPSLLPLIPGGSLYNMMSYGISKDFEMFTFYMINTLQIALLLVLGIVAMTTIFQLVFTGFLKIRKIYFNNNV